jgi:predicted peptidase
LRVNAPCLGLLTALVVSGCAHHVFTPDRANGFVKERGYYVYVPKAWTAERKWPVIVYLHGGQERGSDGVKPTQVGLGPVAWRSKGELPFVVVFPQAPEGTYWGMPSNNERVLAALDDVMTRYSGDPKRVYLTGNSLGGFGTYFLGALHPERFAALAPICGGVRGKAPTPDAPMAEIPDDQRVIEVARRIGNKPMWIFHGAGDWLVPPKFSREMADVFKAQGVDVRLSVYPGVGHNSWDRAYGEPDFFPWLLSHTLP